MTSASSLRAAAVLERKRIRRERLAQLRRNPAFLLGALLLGIWVIAAVFGNFMTRVEPGLVDVLNVNKRPSGEYWFGTDNIGRDVYSRVVAGTRPILLMAFSATAIGTVLGTTLGLLTGYLKGRFDVLVMRISALPVIVIALLALAALDGQSEVITVLIIGFVFTPIIARTVRAAVLYEAELDYVAAAKLRTERMPHILFAEILPNVLPPIIVEFTIRLGYAVFAIATLSFLGVGVELGSPNWGSQVAENYSGIFGNLWWATVFPAGAIATLAIGINLIADSIMEAFEI
jgi:peptide/nickel transport system permease protein